MDVIAKVAKVPGGDALAELNRHRKACTETKLYPVLVGADDELERFRQMLSPPSDGGADYLAQASTFDAAAWLADKAPKRKSAWPKAEAPQIKAPSTLFDVLSRTLKPEINIVFVQVENTWELFAKLGYGDWNDCPAPHIHVAVHRYWSEKYKSSPIAVSADVVECYVTQPPAERAAALALAREQHAYCYDIVEQGVGTTGRLASSVLGAKFWYFWWD